MAALKLSFNSDKTITVRVGRSVEHISTLDKSKAQIFEQVKWACISKDATLTEAQITESLYRLFQDKREDVK